MTSESGGVGMSRKFTLNLLVPLAGGTMTIRTREFMGQMCWWSTMMQVTFV